MNMKARILLTLLFVAIGLSMIAFPIYYGYNEPVEAVIMPEPIPTISEPVIEPTASPTPSPEPTVEPTATPSPTPTPTPTIAPTPTPFPKPDFCKDNTNYIVKTLRQWKLSTGEAFEIWSCLDCVPLQDASEVEAFMAWDTIDQVKFNWDNWTCGHYAQHVNHVATENSVICMVVAVQFEGFFHSILAFPTLEGILYVDPMTDSWVTLVDGNPYMTSPMSHKQGNEITWDKIVVRFELLY